MDVNAVVQAVTPYVLPVLFALVIVAVLPLVAGYIVLIERKVMADMQVRLGPMRVGPHGTLQPIADAIKLLLKEDITPARADRWVFTLAPVVALVPALIAFAVIPFDREAHILGHPVALYIADVNVGLLYIVSV